MNRHILEYIDNILKDNSLEIRYQPQFCLLGACFEVVGAEALIRPNTAICHIDHLLQVAIDSDRIADLGYHILRQAAQQVRKWLDQNLVSSKFTISVNIAGEQLQDDDFCETVQEIVAEAEIDPHQVTLELTETSMIDEVNVAKIYSLSAAGFRISIDDFGTGYSSLSRLKLLPVHEIKIDKMFVDDITKTHQDVALITAMYQLTLALDKFTVVEGVENGKQYAMLRDIGFTCFQGHFFSKAEPPGEFENMLTLINALQYRQCLD